MEKMKIQLELPMDCTTGRIRSYHTMYVNCWVRLNKLLQEAVDKKVGLSLVEQMRPIAEANNIRQTALQINENTGNN